MKTQRRNHGRLEQHSRQAPGCCDPEHRQRSHLRSASLAERIGCEGFLAGAIENGILSENLQAEVINDTAQIMAAGGVLVQGMTLVGNVLDITDRHLSYEDVHFKNGQLQRFDGVRLWADALGQRVDASGYDFSGSSAEFDGYNTGFILGADLMASCDARYGAAFAIRTPTSTRTALP